MQCRILIVTDKTQHGYLYVLSAPSGFDPEIQLDLTPKQMLELGVLCGKYLTDCAWRATRRNRSEGTGEAEKQAENARSYEQASNPSRATLLPPKLTLIPTRLLQGIVTY